MNGKLDAVNVNMNPISIPPVIGQVRLRITLASSNCKARIWSSAKRASASDGDSIAFLYLSQILVRMSASARLLILLSALCDEVKGMTKIVMQLAAKSSTCRIDHETIGATRACSKITPWFPPP